MQRRENTFPTPQSEADRHPSLSSSKAHPGTLMSVEVSNCHITKSSQPLYTARIPTTMYGARFPNETRLSKITLLLRDCFPRYTDDYDIKTLVTVEVKMTAVQYDRTLRYAQSLLCNLSLSADLPSQNEMLCGQGLAHGS